MFVEGGSINFTVTIRKNNYLVGNTSFNYLMIKPDNTRTSGNLSVGTEITESSDGTYTFTADKSLVGLYKLTIYRDDDTTPDASEGTVVGQYYYNVVESDPTGEFTI